MNKKILQILMVGAIVLPHSNVTAQYSYDWVKKLAGAHTDWAYDIAVDEEENVITSGSFMIAADFDPSDEEVVELTSADNESHAFLSKLDVDGNYVWVNSLSGKSSGRAVATDQDGNVYAAGTFRDSFDFDNGSNEIVLTSNGLNDVFLSKYSPDGELLWAKSFGGENHDGIIRLTINEDGHVLACGYFAYTVDFDPGAGISEFTAIENGQPNDAFVVSFDGNGEFLWAHQLGGPSISTPNDITFDSEGNVLISGQFSGYLNCDPGLSDFTFPEGGGSDWDVFIVKLTNDGDFIWAKRVGGSDQDVGYGIAVDSNDNIIATGHFGLTVDFDPGAGIVENTVNGNWYDIFVLKLDVDGNFIWVKQMSSTENDYGADVEVDGGGNIYTIGYTHGDCDLDPGAGIAEVEWEGGSDIFISVLNPNGEYLWGENFGAFEDDWGNAIKLDENHMYMTGIYQDNNADFGDLYLMGEGNEDVFVLKMTYPPIINVSDTEAVTFTVYPNPGNDFFSIGGLSELSIITLFDGAGKVVLKKQGIGTLALDVSDLSEGLYSISVQNERARSFQKLVILR